jgi:DNA-binding response OmpR family regulator
MSAKDSDQVDDFSREPIQRQPHSSQRILVVEGEQDLRQLTAEVLIDAGYHVDVAEDGAAAWSALQSAKYELLVTDQFMPDETGVELLKKIRAARMALSVIMVTGVLPTWEFTLHTWLQPVKILLKPYSFTELLGVINNVLCETTGARAETTAPAISSARPAPVGLRL